LRRCSVGITDVWDYEVRYFDGHRWHDTHTPSNDDQFRYSSNIKVIASTIPNAATLVLVTV
jgi:hypothetical protein